MSSHWLLVLRDRFHRKFVLSNIFLSNFFFWMKIWLFFIYSPNKKRCAKCLGLQKECLLFDLVFYNNLCRMWLEKCSCVGRALFVYRSFAKYFWTFECDTDEIWPNINKLTKILEGIDEFLSYFKTRAMRIHQISREKCVQLKEAQAPVFRIISNWKKITLSKEHKISIKFTLLNFCNFYFYYETKVESLEKKMIWK